MDYLKKIFTKKNVLIILAVVLTGGSFFLAKNVLAVDDNYDGVATMVVWLTSWLVHILVYVFGQLLLIAISILIKVCSFNEFVEADIVTTGWVIIRDLANLGIVIMMLVIAFGTTLNKNAYKYQTMLPKLLVSAILINFSKEITGLLISLSQYLMMYFVHAFENIAAGNITYGLGIDDMLSVRKAVRSAGGGAEINDWNVLGALIMGMVMLAVALGVVLTMALMLLRRIVAFWMLLIMSPIYFVADLIPPAKEYASQWKKELTDNLVKGPTLAFMFWLSMTVLSKITDQNRIINLQMQSERAASGGALSTTDYAFFASKMSSPQRVFDYLITIILFLFTMSLAKKAGGMAGKFAGAYSGRLEKVGKWFSSRPGKIGGAALRGVKKSAPSQYLVGMAGGIKGRALDTKLAKGLGLNKEYSEQRGAMKKAQGLERFGGVAGAGAVREAEYRQAKKKQKEMEEKGQLEGGDDSLRQLLKSSLDSGDLNTARALMLKIASSKNANLRTEDLEAYRKAIGVEKENSGSREENDYMKFMEELKDAQKGSGDTMADFKFGIKRDSTGKLIYQDNLEDAVRETFNKKREADFNDPGLFKAFDEEKPEFLAILDELYNKKNMKALGQEGRDSYAKIIQRVLAKEKDGTLTLSTEQKNKYEVLLERMTAKRFERDTGEARVQYDRDITTGVRTESKSYASAKVNPNQDEKQAMEASEKEFQDLTSTTALDQILQGVRRKKNEKQRDDLLYGRETPSEFDEDFEENVLRPTVATTGSAIRPEIYATVNEGRGGDFYDFHDRVGNNIYGLYSELLAEAKRRGVSEIVNSETGTNYTYEEIFKKSDVGQTIERLMNLTTPQAYSNISGDDQKKYRQETEVLLDKLKFLTERADWNAGESNLGTRVSKRVKNRVVENRILNRDEISGAKSVVRELQNSNLSGQEREKKLAMLVAKLEKALKHSQKHNPDQLFVGQLGGLVSRAQKIDVATTKKDLENFIGQIDIVLNQVKAK